MTSRRFFFNRGMIRQNIWQHSWIAVIYLLGLLFALPLQMFLGGNPDIPPRQVEDLFQVGDALAILFILTLPVAAGLALFRYLQHKGAADMMHSLPLRRKHLLTVQLFNGCILLLVPVWLTALVAGLVRNLGGNMFLYSAADVWAWGATASILSLFLFTLTAFVGICIGLTVLQGIVVYILLILPAVLSQIITSHLSMYLYGFSYQNSRSNIDYWSPFLHMINVNAKPYTWGELGIYAALIVLFILLSYLLYRKRQVETAGQALAFTYFNPLFKGGVMLCAMLLSGTYFAQMRPLSIGWAIAGFALGAIIGYAGAEMVIRKTWQILNRKLPLRFAGYAVVLGLLLYLPVSPITGFEARVPAVDKVAEVYAGSRYAAYKDSQLPVASSADYTIRSPYKGVDPFSGDPAYIASVRKLHEVLVQARPGENEDPYKYHSTRIFNYTLVYKLRNGLEIARQYSVPLAGFEPELKAVMESPEYKRAEYLLPLLDKPLASIQVGSDVRSVSITDPAEITAFKELLKKEILNMSFKDQLDDSTPLALIQVGTQESIKNPYSGYLYDGYDWRASYHELGAWLEQKGYAERIKTKPDDLLTVEVAKQSEQNALPKGLKYDPMAQLELARKEGRSVIVKDKARIEEILNIRRNYSVKTGSYTVIVKSKQGGYNFYRLDASEMTPELKGLLP
ncbi:ABC-2 type transport system permease protein [Paenibacillus forsythiae]|uniref:ABC-2 type transport system permease protein n=1 Tax=Paenibacillus forsythiae TaxID=365616 RepID=A0ABU3H8H2_9BACL|nr:hypothetical protein [Paenibacillus forsythiae]MDT3427120.1 ABC-2 type transport system permease protein [Paenibacillus forsythiae]